MLQVKEEAKGLLESFVNTGLFSEETYKRANDADILFLPDIGLIDEFEKAFRPDTKRFYKFIASNNQYKYKVELFENKEEEQVLNFHSHDIYFPVIFLKDHALFQDVINLAIEYVLYRIEVGKNDNPIVNLILKVEHNEKCEVYTYKGFIAGVKKAFGEIK